MCGEAGGRGVQLTLSSSIGRSRPTSLEQVNSVNSVRTAELGAVSWKTIRSCLLDCQLPCKGAKTNFLCFPIFEYVSISADSKGFFFNVSHSRLSISRRSMQGIVLYSISTGYLQSSARRIIINNNTARRPLSECVKTNLNLNQTRKTVTGWRSAWTV